MGEDYVAEYRLLAKVLPITGAIRQLSTLRRYRVVLVDESHNLRNRAGKRYIQENEGHALEAASAESGFKVAHSVGELSEDEDFFVRVFLCKQFEQRIELCVGIGFPVAAETEEQ